MKPTYQYTKKEKVKKATIYILLDKVLTVLGVLVTFLFVLVLLGKAVVHHISYWSFVVIWVFLTYLVLPRIHQLFTSIYIPTYFLLRTKTGDGLLGDPVNMGFLGSEKDIHACMRRAGFVMADPITFKSSLGIVISSLLGKKYPAAPVSSLYLFERKQDFAYQQEVEGSSVQRHHIRFYKVDEGWKLINGQKVDYLAAGTFDCGIGMTNATLQVTHKIDEFVDCEREYIKESLCYYDKGVRSEMVRVLPTPIKDVNGGGDAISTDGNLALVDVRGAYERAMRDGVDLEQIDTIDFIKDNDVLVKELPPKSFMVIGLGIFIKMIVLSVLFVMLWMNMQGSEDELIVLGFIGVEFVSNLIGFVLYRLSYRKHKWARLVLMGLLLVGAVLKLVEVYLASSLTMLEVFDASISMALMLVASSYDIRQFVYQVIKRGDK